MATGNLVMYTSIQSPPVSCVYGEARIGSNGNSGGDSELFIGHSGSDGNSGRVVWESGTAGEGNFDSGVRAVSLSIPAGGGTAAPALWSVNGASSNPISYSGKTYGSISQVTITAGVQINAAVLWTNVLVEFYRAGNVVDSYSLSGGPCADTRSEPNAVSEAILTVTPGGPADQDAKRPPGAKPATSPVQALFDSVVVTGSIELLFDNGVFPGTDDLFTQIFVATSSCT
jgi:hypothetical protein